MGILISIAMALSILFALLSFFIAMATLSWKGMLISFIASLPVSVYFLGVNPPFSFIGWLPLLPLSMTFLFAVKFREGHGR